ncbi:MAG: tetratricopeptide repeat protein [Gemmatimonadaceae bacterium]|nr:tetratricopeptide repeat protein [Chitinophagaceae bacterium]
MKSLTTIVLSACTLASFAQAGDSSEFYYKKGVDSKNERRYLLASQHFQKSVQFNASNTAAQKELGHTYVEMKKYDLAKNAYVEVLKKEPTDPATLENITNIYFWTRKWPEAIAHAKKMQELKIGKNTNYIIGKSYYESEDYGQMLKYLQAATKDDSLNAEIPYIIGRSFVDMSNYRAAVPYFEKAIGLDTTKSRWVYETAMNYAAIPDDKNAVRVYQLAATRGYRTDNDYYENLATSYIGLKQPEKGLELLKTVLEKKPADMELLYSVADLSYKTGKYQDAIDYWDRVLTLDKQNFKSLYMIGLSYQKKGDKSKGMALCDQAIRMDPSLANLREQKQMPGM